jgi:hypothetical protein
MSGKYSLPWKRVEEETTAPVHRDRDEAPCQTAAEGGRELKHVVL